MKRLNLGIVAHVDAGKTSLTERLLFSAGVIREIGSVDAGNTQTDTLALERQRGITIRSAVVSFVLGDVAVNLIDTPGHPDFIAEVDRSLGVLDGAVLVASAVEGVQAQTIVLAGALRRLGIPFLVFVNKIDRRGARTDDLVAEIEGRLGVSSVPLARVDEAGTRVARVLPIEPGEQPQHEWLVERLADHDPEILRRVVAGEYVPATLLRASFEQQARQGLVTPLFFGSAMTGAGIDELRAGIPRLLPAREYDAEADLAGTVFKVERGQSGEKIAFVRIATGSLAVRETVPFGIDGEAKVTALRIFERGKTVVRTRAVAGEIAQAWGLAGVQVGDGVGASRTQSVETNFSRPSLETVVSPVDPGQAHVLHAALVQISEQDPLINLQIDEERHELLVSLYGEVQKEVIQSTLATDYGIEVEFRESAVIHIERVAGAGEAVEFKYVSPNPFLATIGLRVEPGPAGSGNVFRLDSAVLGTMPLAFFKAVEDTVHRTLHQGLYGWQVSDCLVTMTHSGYAPRQSHAHQKFSKSMSSTGEDFRNLTPLVLMAALFDARTEVCEPLEAIRIEMPVDTVAAVMPVLAGLRGFAAGQEVRGGRSSLEGMVPTANIHAFQRALPGLTRGEGVLESAPGDYMPVRGDPPTRRRLDHNPLDRKEYLQHVLRRT